MTQYSYFWGGIGTGDAPATSGYSDLDFANFVQLFLSMYDDYEDFIIFPHDPATDTNEPFEVTQDTGSNMFVKVHEGYAMMFGKVYYNDAELTLEIADNNSSNPRKDTIVFEMDWVAKTIRTVVVQGTPAVSPSAPTLTQNEGVLYQYPLADVDVIVSETEITDSEITARTNRRYKRHEINRLVGEMTMWTTSTAPDGWLICDGSEYDSTDERYSKLYAVIGTTYNTGGETADHFRVPDIASRIPIGVGSGSGLSTYALADQGGSETHQLTESELASHTHTFAVNNLDSANPNTRSGDGANVGNDTTNSTGGDSAHTSIQPYLAVNFIIKY